MSVRTVLGDIEASDMGKVDYHEHLFHSTPLLQGDELVDEDVSTEESKLLKQAGIDSIIEATPIGLGRNPLALSRVSSKTDLKIVATTGCHRSAHYPSDHWLFTQTPQELANRFILEISQGLPANDAKNYMNLPEDTMGFNRAGLLKVGLDYWKIDKFSRTVVEAIGIAHQKTNAPVMVHLEFGSCAMEIIDLLNSLGVDSSAIVLAHIDRLPDPVFHREIVERGVYVGYDGAARLKDYPENILVDCLISLAKSGPADRILIGGDVARASRFSAAGGMPGLAYLPSKFIPKIAKIGGEELIHSILVENPQRFLNRF